MDLSYIYLFFDGMTVLAGILLVVTGFLSGAEMLKWWGSAYFIGAAGLGAFIAGRFGAHWLAHGLAPGLLLMAYGMMWLGARRLAGRSSPMLLALLPGLAWWAIGATLPFAAKPWLYLVAQTPLTLLMIALLLVEVVRIPAPAAARYPLAAALVVHGVFIVVRAADLLQHGTPAALRLWLVISAGEGIIFVFCDALCASHLVRMLRERLLDSAAHTDFLTGVLNRRGFTIQAERRLRATSCMLLVLDIDGFKRINDTLGHAEGDRLLRELGRICMESVRAGDVVGRLGGDEFAILIDGGTGETASSIATRIRQAFAQTLTAHGLEVGVSIGIDGAKPGNTLDDLLRQADMRLYRAKGSAPRVRKLVLGAG
ncbi:MULTISPECIES: diguanylate cyclase [unclassified Acidiphilium]|jgi:diguanylate cyclase (GGDEF)-like protein|uniref:GGDEF domain-containing protein n=1 Tax=unclassified Acidiphilium TaxID=2617493 RepID=UPI000BCB20C3|nr:MULTISPECIES: GGDEF domain-containing protein [unclassified Acidiphilium]OYV57028.1 MAG: GGDEF domain-containing protein [Acidiphilium sp. 20-67-58]HQT61804.1 GGDEF domain-containing protein [Acidiphilium sp.]